MFKSYIAVIGDIVNSKKIKNRNEFQSLLENTLEEINYEYKQFITSKFLITLGDEFQGVLSPNAPTFDILTKISFKIYPAKIRFGIGYGPISTDIKEIALGMDGPSFYLAREAIDLSKNKEGFITLKSDVMKEEEVKSINTMLGLLSVIYNTWNETMNKAVFLLKEGKTQNEIANYLGIRQPSISKTLKSYNWNQVKQLENQTSNLMVYFMYKYEQT